MKKESTSRKSGSDIKRLSAMTDDDIDTSDIPAITPAQFARSVVRRGLKPIPAKALLPIRVDREVLDWYRKQTVA